MMSRMCAFATNIRSYLPILGTPAAKPDQWPAMQLQPLSSLSPLYNLDQQMPTLVHLRAPEM